MIKSVNILDNVCSVWGKIQYGVPLGSILGLFNL